MHSKAKYLDDLSQDDIDPEELGAIERDEIGLIRSICVKVCIDACFIRYNLSYQLYRHALHLCVKTFSRQSNGVATYHNSIFFST